METYDLTEPLARLIKQLEKGREFTRELRQTIYDAMVVSKEITLWNRNPQSMKTYDSGDCEPQNSRHGMC